MSKNKKCVIFDFDMVLTKHNLYEAIKSDDYPKGINENKIQKWDAASKCLARGCLCLTEHQKAKFLTRAHHYSQWFFGGSQRVKSLIKFFKNLVEKSVDLYIVCGTGNLEIVIGALEGSGIDLENFKKICVKQKKYDPKTKKFGKCQTKSKFIEMLLKKYETVVYIDDNEKWFAKFKKMGAHSISIETKNGMIAKDMKKIQKYLGIVSTRTS